MVPHVFVSSTIEDLAHLRDALRTSIHDLGYQPILSDHGGIGFSPHKSTLDSCLAATTQCHLAVLIVGKRYGTRCPDGVSATHQELRAARQHGIPIFCLVDRDVLAYRRVAESNADPTALNFPGMEAPLDTFAMLDEIASASVNNALIPFEHTSEAVTSLRHQLAHYVCELVRAASGPIATDVKELLAELKTLRLELTPASDASRTLLPAVRLLVSDRFRTFNGLIETVSGPIDQALESLLNAPSLDSWLKSTTGHQPVIAVDPDDIPLFPALQDESSPWRWLSVFGPLPGIPSHDEPMLRVATRTDGKVTMSPGAAEALRALHTELRQSVGR